MIKRVPRFAELRFAELCAGEGALCHHSEEDEGGWDYFVEFPAQPLAAPADTHPARKSAFVQVKSTRQHRLTCRLKLSNALRAAQEQRPWFVVLIIADAKNKPPRVYAVHVWEDLIRQTLLAVRRAANDKAALNRRSLTIRFDPADERGAQLLSWMHDEIAKFDSDYEQRKKRIFETIGYEDGYGLAEIILNDVTFDDFLQNLLGLESGMPLKSFKFTRSRFGVLSTESEIDESSGIIYITPSPAGACEIRLRDSRSSASIVLPGQIYYPGIPGMSFQRSRFRFSTELLEIVWSPSGKAECYVKFFPNETRDLLLIEELSTLMMWSVGGSIDMQIWSDNKRIVGGTLTLDQEHGDFDWAEFATIMRLLRLIAGSMEHRQIQLRFADLCGAQRHLVAFQRLVEAPSLRLEFEPLPGAPPRFSSLLYYFYVDVCHRTFYAVVERPISEDISLDGRRRVTCGLPQTVEAYVLKNATENQRKTMADDYQRHLQRREETGTPLGFGDIHAFLEQPYTRDRASLKD
jgi:hypothetical protein